MANFEQATVTCVDNGISKQADILSKTDKKIVVAVVSSEARLVMYKKTPAEKNYIGTLYGMEFVTTGEPSTTRTTRHILHGGFDR